MYYRTCPNCGAALDPGERCDCHEPSTNREGATSEPARNQNKTAADATNIDDGRAEQKSDELQCSTSILSDEEEGGQA